MKTIKQNIDIRFRKNLNDKIFRIYNVNCKIVRYSIIDKHITLKAIGEDDIYNTKIDTVFHESDIYLNDFSKENVEYMFSKIGPNLFITMLGQSGLNLNKYERDEIIYLIPLAGSYYQRKYLRNEKLGLFKLKKYEEKTKKVLI